MSRVRCAITASAESTARTSTMAPSPKLTASLRASGFRDIAPLRMNGSATRSESTNVTTAESSPLSTASDVVALPVLPVPRSGNTAATSSCNTTCNARQIDR
eukprot:Amastigsp_a5149_10.p3 type:complete len:102 gc:universal Amastigsp_a5149_10:533-228(-)